MRKHSKNKHDGFAIAIAWPETFCKQPGSWYDGITALLGVNRNHYYRAGHAALVLVDGNTRACHYFDFGRYHAPFQHGRVRSGETDPGLMINTCAEISNDGESIENMSKILFGLQQSSEYHGEGPLYASYCKVNFGLAFQKAVVMQEDSPIPYGPFRNKGSNCSRFVNTCILAGKPERKYCIRLKYFIPFTPTPMNNVNSLDNKTIIPHPLAYKPASPKKVMNKKQLKTTLPEPERTINLPFNAQWLSGEGAGSWFTIEGINGHFLVRRFSPEGKLEFENNFSLAHNHFLDLNKPFRFKHLCHSKQVHVIQEGTVIELISLNTKTGHYYLSKISERIFPVYNKVDLQ